jgi:hypothetical protein
MACRGSLGRSSAGAARTSWVGFQATKLLNPWLKFSGLTGAMMSFRERYYDHFFEFIKYFEIFSAAFGHAWL